MQSIHSHSHSQAPQPKSGDASATEGRLIRWARFYDPFVWMLTIGQTRRLRALPLDLAAIQPGERVLEVGCGTGEVALRAARRVGPQGVVVGIDAAPEMITVARRKARSSGSTVQFRVEPVEALTSAAGTFDVVLSSLMMHHLPGDLKRRALVECRRVLRPGGRIVIVDAQEARQGGHIWQPGVLAARLHGRGTLPPLESGGLPTLAALLRDTGFTAVTTGSTSMALMGYAQGRVAD